MHGQIHQQIAHAGAQRRGHLDRAGPGNAVLSGAAVGMLRLLVGGRATLDEQGALVRRLHQQLERQTQEWRDTTAILARFLSPEA